METIFVLLAYVFQIGITLLITSIIPFIMSLLIRANKKKKIKILGTSFIVSLIIVLGTITYIANNPIVNCPKELQANFTKQVKHDIKSCNKGFYSSKLPIFPINIKVLEVGENNVKVQINYLYLGNTRMEIIDGIPSIYKPLY